MQVNKYSAHILLLRFFRPAESPAGLKRELFPLDPDAFHYRSVERSNCSIARTARAILKELKDLGTLAFRPLFRPLIQLRFANRAAVDQGLAEAA